MTKSHSEVDWGKVEWKFSDHYLSGWLDIDVDIIKAVRKELGRPSDNARSPCQVDRVKAQADWSHTNPQIANELGVNIQTVRRCRPDGVLPTPKFQIVWNALDWSLTDTEIAAAVGCARSTVNWHRNRLKRLGLLSK